MLNSNSTYACFNCRKAWKTGGVCGCPSPDVVYMGKKWRAPRSNRVNIWNKMRRDREAGVKGWALWDKQTIDSRQQSKRPYVTMTHEEKQQQKERIARARANVEYHAIKWRQELMEMWAEKARRHKEIRQEINRRRKQQQE